LIIRPGVDTIAVYRRHVDAAMLALIDSIDAGHWPEVRRRSELGLHHEMQHQELILTDLLHLLAQNPTDPVYQPYWQSYQPGPAHRAPPLRWHGYDGGLRMVGHAGPDFAFDNESPRHTAYVPPYRLASRATTNGEWLAFMTDGGYRTPTLWLSDGWARVQAEGWFAPLYWQDSDGNGEGKGADGGWTAMTLAGRRPVDHDAPVCHLSYYEADAFARWAGKRLPTEAEWEVAAADTAVAGNFVGAGLLRPCPASDDGVGHPAQMFGDVWEWTASPYVPYPGFRPPPGAIGEYNGKFMCNQMVLRGGSCATPDGHLRPTYRNFFYPHQRWQFTGLRLAEDG
jgi:ergothioneine biosynthesis protein EgtB